MFAATKMSPLSNVHLSLTKAQHANLLQVLVSITLKLYAKSAANVQYRDKDKTDVAKIGGSE